ncbi:MAG: ATPase, T2SS/T4P/T4SS family [Planctomycetota bacterium]|nr:ATPase, T2SS/T4P/T4SS family [Planctomycetota bacterium]
MTPDHPALAPIRSLLSDPEISEIMINGPAQTFVERHGVMELTDVRFRSEAQLQELVTALLQPTGREVSSASPFADFRLADGSRGNVVIAPIAMDGPVVTIRKMTNELKGVDDLIRAGTISEPMASLLAAGVQARANILFTGATGTGKTTTLGIFGRFIPETERVIVIEDTAELQFQQKHVIRLECRQANLQGRGAVSMSQLVKNALRMRPTRIIVGEIRGDEAVDMLQAITSGHEGCLAVLHASSALDAVSRLEMMSLSRGLLLPLWAIQKQIVSAIDLIVQHEMLPDGARKVTGITELTEARDGAVALTDIFEYRRLGLTPDGRERGEWLCRAAPLRVLAKCRKMGVDLPAEVFKTDGAAQNSPA